MQSNLQNNCDHRLEGAKHRFVKLNKSKKRLTVLESTECCQCGSFVVSDIKRKLLVYSFRDLAQILESCNSKSEVLKVSKYIDYTIDAYSVSQARQLFSLVRMYLLTFK